MTDQTKTILIVEDESPFRQIYKDALSAYHHFRVLEAEDGETALAVVEKEVPDLILLDLILPQKSGFDVLSELKNNPKYKDIPIIVYSVIDEKSEIEKAMNLGANDYTIKGTTPAVEVVNKVKVLLDIPIE